MRLLVWFSAHFKKTIPFKKGRSLKKNRVWIFDGIADMIFDTFWENFAFQKSRSLKNLMLSNPNMGRVDSTFTRLPLKPYGLHMGLGGGVRQALRNAQNLLGIWSDLDLSDLLRSAHFDQIWSEFDHKIWPYPCHLRSEKF